MTHLYNQTTKFYQRGRDEAKNFEAMLRKALREEADEPLYTIASHPRWYSSQSPPPHVCLVSHLVSRSPATTFLMRSYKPRRTRSRPSRAPPGRTPRKSIKLSPRDDGGTVVLGRAPSA